ncbi:hypothetical protein BDZ45DRAFT_676484 [Acephala macrosclerotiorum]|nr:hypothetical protein BDZ45DRAFT_676484 [Acephala macrosclerotiorum]
MSTLHTNTTPPGHAEAQPHHTIITSNPSSTVSSQNVKPRTLSPFTRHSARSSTPATYYISHANPTPAQKSGLLISKLPPELYHLIISHLGPATQPVSPSTKSTNLTTTKPVSSPI